VDDLAAECLHAGERLTDVGDGEVREREAVAGPGAAIVQPERYSAFPGLQSAAFALLAVGERDTQQPFPEPAGALEVVGGKLDEGELGHAAMVAAPASSLAPEMVLAVREPAYNLGIL
jgi:hypothetical protein